MTENFVYFFILMIYVGVGGYWILTDLEKLMSKNAEFTAVLGKISGSVATIADALVKLGDIKVGLTEDEATATLAELGNISTALETQAAKAAEIAAKV